MIFLRIKLPKFVQFNSIEANREHACFCSNKFFFFRIISLCILEMEVGTFFDGFRLPAYLRDNDGNKFRYDFVSLYIDK